MVHQQYHNTAKRFRATPHHDITNEDPVTIMLADDNDTSAVYGALRTLQDDGSVMCKMALNGTMELRVVTPNLQMWNDPHGTYTCTVVEYPDDAVVVRIKATLDLKNVAQVAAACVPSIMTLAPLAVVTIDNFTMCGKTWKTSMTLPVFRRAVARMVIDLEEASIPRDRVLIVARPLRTSLMDESLLEQCKFSTINLSTWALSGRDILPQAPQHVKAQTLAYFLENDMYTQIIDALKYIATTAEASDDRAAWTQVLPIMEHRVRDTAMDGDFSLLVRMEAMKEPSEQALVSGFILKMKGMLHY